MTDLHLLRRYQTGEHEGVWAEMMALGPRLREARYVEDAWAVARETMLRARHNVETIIERLDALGYRFWDGRQGPRRGPPRKLTFGQRQIEAPSLDAMLSAMFEEARSIPPEALTSVMVEQLHNIYRMTVWPWQDTWSLARGERHPADAAATALFEEARRIAPAQVALRMLPELDRLHRLAMNELCRAWKEREGGRPEAPKVVDHRKDKSVFQAPRNKDAALIKRLEKRGVHLPMSLRAWIEDVGSVNLTGSHPRLCFWEDETFPGVHADPLMVSVDTAEIEARTDEIISGEGRSLDIVVGWDARAKSRLTVEDVELDCGYSVMIPTAAADAILVGRTPATSFVEYLRLSFRWGGFPGWEWQESPPREDIEFLTQGLLSL